MRQPIPRSASSSPVPTLPPVSSRVSVLDFLHLCKWLDGTPVLAHIEPYRRQILSTVLDTWDPVHDRIQYNQALVGRAKKNWKSADLVLACLFKLVANDSPGGNVVYLIANDETQAGDDLTLAKKLIEVSPHLRARVVLRAKAIERRDGKGELLILPADILGAHGKSYVCAAFDEIHGYRSWDLLEALQLDPTRRDAQMLLTSYASLIHRPGIPLYDLLALAKAGTDPRFFCSWYGADWTTDPAAQDLSPVERANPSRGTWTDPDYLEQQQRRLPSHKFRRLHLNLPGSPEGSALSAETIMDAITRGVRIRHPEPGIVYHGFVDMSGGSDDDATLAIAYKDADGRGVLAYLADQGPAPPFDPRAAVARFAALLKAYGVSHVCGDRYAGMTFQLDFLKLGIQYDVAGLTTSKIYEAFEPYLNSREVVLLDHPELESQLLSLLWRGAKITHPNGEHDDFATSACGALLLALDPAPDIDTEMSEDEEFALRKIGSGIISGIPIEEFGGNLFPDQF